MKESWRFQQYDTPGQTLWQLRLPCRLARARRKLGWALCFGADDPAGTNWRLRLPDSSSHPKSQLFFLFCCRHLTVVQWWALSSEEVATALPFEVFERITGPSDSSGLGETFQASTLLHPCLQTLAWYSPGEVNGPELPWPRWECLKKGVTWIVMAGGLITALLKLLRIFSEAEQFQAHFPHGWRQKVVPISALFGRKIKILHLGLSTYLELILPSGNQNQFQWACCDVDAGWLSYKVGVLLIVSWCQVVSKVLYTSQESLISCRKFA